jgi:hypothetical protein
LLTFQQRSQKVGEVRLRIGGTLRQCLPLSAQRRQLQLFTQGMDALLLQVHATSSSDWYTDSGCCSDSKGTTLARGITARP